VGWITKEPLLSFQLKQETFSSPKYPDQLRVPSSILFNGFLEGTFPRVKVAMV